MDSRNTNAVREFNNSISNGGVCRYRHVQTGGGKSVFFFVCFFLTHMQLVINMDQILTRERFLSNQKSLAP